MTPYRCIILIVFILINNACSSAKKTVVQKENLSEIQTLVFLTPHLNIESYNQTSSALDEKINSALRLKATEIVSATLKGKYIIQNEPYTLQNKDEAELRIFFTELDTLKKSLSELRIPITLLNEKTKESKRYVLATYISGFYNSDFPPNYAFKQSTFSNTIQLGKRPVLSGINIRLIIADRKTERILLYSTNQSYTIDPRLSHEVEQMLKTLIRPIYYK